MRVADGDHRGKDVAPGPWIRHHAVGEHAAVPADVLEGAGSIALIVPQPVARVTHNVEFAVGIVGQSAELPKWMVAIDPGLGSSPLEAIENDRLPEVLERLRAMRDGIPQ